jgi:hypothetical protein
LLLLQALLHPATLLHALLLLHPLLLFVLLVLLHQRPDSIKAWLLHLL